MTVIVVRLRTFSPKHAGGYVGVCGDARVGLRLLTPVDLDLPQLTSDPILENEPTEESSGGSASRPTGRAGARPSRPPSIARPIGLQLTPVDAS